MCLSRAINCPRMLALVTWQMVSCRTCWDEHRHPTENLHLLCQEGARGKERHTEIIQASGRNPLQVDWESCRAGRGIDGQGREAEMSSRSGTGTGAGTDSIIQLLDDRCPSLNQEASQFCSCL